MVDKLKGVLLCGGQGTRLRPLTEVVNKHLIRLHDLPMAEYPLKKMIDAGIKEIMIVSGGENFAAVVKYFGSGKKWGVDIVHAIQDEAGGIAQAVGLAKNFVGHDKFLVILGDNVFSMPLKKHVEYFSSPKFSYSCMLFAKWSNTPQRFGTIKYRKGHAVDIIEKPKDPPSNMILTGVYMYRSSAFDAIASLTPSDRGELEITDVNRTFVKINEAKIMEMHGWWSDCGTMKTLLETEELIKNGKE